MNAEIKMFEQMLADHISYHNCKLTSCHSLLETVKNFHPHYRVLKNEKVKTKRAKDFIKALNWDLKKEKILHWAKIFLIFVAVIVFILLIVEIIRIK